MDILQDDKHMHVLTLLRFTKFTRLHVPLHHLTQLQAHCIRYKRMYSICKKVPIPFDMHNCMSYKALNKHNSRKTNCGKLM